MAACSPHFDCFLFVLAAGLGRIAGLEIAWTARWGSLIHHILAQWSTAVHHMVADNPGTAVAVRSPVRHRIPERTVGLHIPRIGIGRIAERGRIEIDCIRHSHHRVVDRIAPCLLMVVVGIDRLLVVDTVPRTHHVLFLMHIDWVEAARDKC